MNAAIVVWCRACQGPHHDCEYPVPHPTLRQVLLVLFWNVVDWPAMLAAGALSMVMLATLPIRDEDAVWSIYRWDWANRLDHRLDAISFDGLSYWLWLRMGKPSGGNGTVPLSRFNRFVRTHLDPRS